MKHTRANGKAADNAENCKALMAMYKSMKELADKLERIEESRISDKRGDAE